MAVTTFSLKFLAALGVDTAKLEGNIDKIGMEVEKTEGDDVYIDITPNRPDLLDSVGFARAMRYLDGKETPKSNFYALKNKPDLTVIASESVKKVRPVIEAMVVKNANLHGKLKYIINFMEKLSETYGRKRKKIAMGMHNLDAIEPPLHYDAKYEGSFVPLGSEKEMSFKQILEEHEKGMAYANTVKAGMYPVLSDSKGSIMSLIPIINSQLTKVKEDTKNLFIDITGTSEPAVRNALNILACMFIDLGFEVYPCIIEREGKELVTPQLSYREVRLRPSLVKRAIGADIDQAKIITLLNKMGFDGAIYGRYVLAYVPPYRIDVLNQQDLIEDIAIAYGYNNIIPMPVAGTSVGIPDEQNEFSDRLSNLLIGMGFSEAVNNYLTNEEINFKRMKKPIDSERVVKLAYSKVEIYSMLRTSIMPGLLQNLSISAHEPLPQRLFETGLVFGVENGKPFEKRMLAFVSEDSRAEFSDIRSYVEALLGTLGIEHKLEAHDDPSFIKGRCAAIVSNGTAIGIFGEIAPDVLESFGISAPVIGCEIEFMPLFERCCAESGRSNAK